jgi:hypothetical protein
MYQQKVIKDNIPVLWNFCIICTLVVYVGCMVNHKCFVRSVVICSFHRVLNVMG